MDGTMSGLMLFGTIIGIALLYLVEKINKEKKSSMAVLIFFVLSFIILGIVQIGLIQYSIKGAGQFDILFVNDLGMPFFSGFAFFFIVVAIGIWLLLRIASRKGCISSFGGLVWHLH